ncbi:MAG: DNA-formamidopyrimidine glycosylase [Bacillota bacterium]|jgi:formamidopyrimidine-DNA glycosylase
MPELPEVETVRRSLLPHLVGQTIEDVEIGLQRIIKYPHPDQFVASIRGRQFLAIERRGKYLLFRLTGDYTLVIHLRMTGQLRLAPSTQPLPKYTHVLFQLRGGDQLRFSDMRQFGAMYLAPDHDIARVANMEKLGWEPLEHFPVEEFAGLLSSRRTKIKNLLLNQCVIAGVGNIYADESLFLAGIHPETPAHELSFEQVQRLHDCLIRVLQAGVAMRGTTFSDYVDGLGESGSFQHQLTVYGREGQPCPKCGQPIQRTKLAGRSAHFCAQCQRCPRP